MFEILITATGCLLACRGNLLYSNLTTIANSPTDRLTVLVYFTLSIIYLGLKTLKIAKRYSHQHWLTPLIYLNGIMLISALILPYQEKRHDWLSTLHVSGAFFGFVLYGCLWMIILYDMSMADSTLYNRCRNILLTTITATCIAMFSMGNINSLSELFVIGGTCRMVHMILHEQA